MKRITLLLAVAAMGCRHAPAAPAEVSPAAPPPESPAAAAPAPAQPVATAPPARACAADAECGPAQLCVDARCTDATAGLAACRATVHFAYDSASPAGGELPALARVARCAQAGAAPSLVIEGSADERGTVEYNLALGDRRATAVATYLERLGVSRAQLRTVSYGKERPVCTEHTEACWAENRRAAAAPVP